MAQLVYSEQQNAPSSTSLSFGAVAAPGHIVVISSTQASNPTQAITQTAATWLTYKGTPIAPNLYTFVGYNITSEFNTATISGLTTSGSLIFAIFSGLRWQSNPVRGTPTTSAAFGATNTITYGANVTTTNGDMFLGIEWGYNTGTMTYNQTQNTGTFTTIQNTTNARQVGMSYLYTATGQTTNYGAISSTGTLAIQQITLIGADPYTGSGAMGGQFSTLTTPSSNTSISTNIIIGPPNNLSSGGVGS